REPFLGCFPSGGITPLQQMLASGTGAILTSLFVTPLDVVKIRLQAQRTPFSKGNPTQGRVGVSSQPPPPPQPRSRSASEQPTWMSQLGRACDGDFSAPERGAVARWQVTMGPSS
uniref:Mitochondrial glutathione transporter SLC25A39 n=1 Tax=Strix occidentalis caurina TaxID=311401 RepID=A0A8D0KU33_STROC